MIVNAGPHPRPEEGSGVDSPTVPPEESLDSAEEAQPVPSLEETGAGDSNGEEPVRVEEGRNRKGRFFVRVYGTKEDAMKVHAQYLADGREPTICKADRYNKGAWYFYIR